VIELAILLGQSYTRIINKYQLKIIESNFSFPYPRMSPLDFRFEFNFAYVQICSATLKGLIFTTTRANIWFTLEKN